MGLHQTKKLLHRKGNHQQNEKAAYQMEVFANHMSDKAEVPNLFGSRDWFHGRQFSPRMGGGSRVEGRQEAELRQ